MKKVFHFAWLTKTGNSTWKVCSIQGLTKRAGQEIRHDLGCVHLGGSGSGFLICGVPLEQILFQIRSVIYRMHSGQGFIGSLIWVICKRIIRSMIRRFPLGEGSEISHCAQRFWPWIRYVLHIWEPLPRSVDSICVVVMYQSNRSFNIPPRAYPGHLTSFPAREGGNFINVVFPGAGIWSLLIGGGEFDR